MKEEKLQSYIGRSVMNKDGFRCNISSFDDKGFILVLFNGLSVYRNRVSFTKGMRLAKEYDTKYKEWEKLGKEIGVYYD